MAKRELPSPEVLRQLLRYEPETGKLFWLPRGPEWFEGAKDVARMCRLWNTRYANKPAMDCVRKRVKHGSIIGGHMLAHRVIWALVYGTWPQGDVDHINGDSLDNRILNLRDVSHAENQKNMAVRKDNTTGTPGVAFDKRKRKWIARIHLSGRNKWLGYYATMDEAVQARASANLHYKFHPNHGRVKTTPSAA